MVLITHGFNTKLAALQFEWAWQNPQKSRRLAHLSKKQTKENVFTYKLRILSEMLNTGPWNRLSLTIQWLKQEYYVHFPISRPPPTHMPIAYGEIKTVKKKVRSPKKDKNESDTEDVVGRDGLLSCCICYVEDVKDTNNPILHCIVDTCQFVGHLTCLAAEFLKQTMDKGKYLIPVSGRCPSCNEEVLWADVIKQKRYSLHPGDCSVDFRDSQEEEIHDTQEDASDDDEDAFES